MVLHWINAVVGNLMIRIQCCGKFRPTSRVTKNTIKWSPVWRMLYDATRQHWQWSRITFANTPVAFENLHKPGGTFIMTLGNVTGRVESTYQDNWGQRVSHTWKGIEVNAMAVHRSRLSCFDYWSFAICGCCCARLLNRWESPTTMHICPRTKHARRWGIAKNQRGHRKNCTDSSKQKAIARLNSWDLGCSRASAHEQNSIHKLII